MSCPEAPSSKVSPDKSLLNHSADADELAKLLPDTTQYFEDWLQALKPSQPGQNLASPSDAVVSNYVPEKPREIRFEGTLSVDGYLAGFVCGEKGTLITTAAGEVDGDVSVDIAIIHGLVRGDIKAATRVELGSTARVIGDIEALALEIQTGAVFEGRCSFPPAAANESVVNPTSSSSSLTGLNEEENPEARAALAATR